MQRGTVERGKDYLWDTAYYNGKFYVYFGILPLLIFFLPYYAITKKYLDIEEAQKEVDSIKRPSVYILKRSENTGYASFDQDSSIIENISVVFPVFFSFFLL